MCQACAGGRFIRNDKTTAQDQDKDLTKNQATFQETVAFKIFQSKAALIVSVTFQIPAALREFTGGQASVEIGSSPRVLRDALEELWVQYPGVRDRISTEQGVIRQHINIFVGN